MTDRQSRIAALHAAAKERILILDGSWGVMFQRMELTEKDYRFSVAVELIVTSRQFREIRGRQYADN